MTQCRDFCYSSVCVFTAQSHCEGVTEFLEIRKKSVTNSRV